MLIFRILRTRRRGDVSDEIDITSLLLGSKFGRRLRLGIITATVMSYPVMSLFLNGPLLKSSFPLFQKVDNELSNRVDGIVTEEYERFLGIEKKTPKEVVVSFYRSTVSSGLDSLIKGTLALRSGVNIAFPFYVKFENKEEASDYCERNFKNFLFYDDNVNIPWDSQVGQEIAETFCLSDKALKFLVLRDLYANEDYRAYISKELSWAGYSSLAGFFTYIIHQYSKFRHSLSWFLLILMITSFFAYYGSKYWHQVYRHVADLRADEKAGIVSNEHREGGMEYYWKMLKRNRLLSSLMPDGVSKKVTASGDVKGVTTSFIKRYLQMKQLLVNSHDTAVSTERFSLDD